MAGSPRTTEYKVGSYGGRVGMGPCMCCHQRKPLKKAPESRGYMICKGCADAAKYGKDR